MNAFQIPERSFFAGDPAFYGQRQQQHRGAPIHIEPKAPKAPKVARGSNDGHGGGRPSLKSRSVLAMYEYRQQGHTWDEVASAFYCSAWFARAKVLEQYPEIARIHKGRGKAAPKRKDLSTEQLRAYYAEVQCYRKVAERFNTCVGTVHYRLIGRLKGGSKTQPAPSESPQNHADLANTCFFSDSGEADRKALD